MGEEPSLSISILRHPKSQLFLRELLSAEKNLPISQSSLFMKTVLSHFAYDIPKETGNFILTTISHILLNEEHLNLFQSGGFSSDLPFSQPQFYDSLFEVIRAIIQTNPNLADENICTGFSHMIATSPRKSLTLLALFAQSFESIEDPWKMLDLLIQQAQDFYSEEVQYASLLVFLNQSFQEYSSARAIHCWHQLSARIEKSRDPVPLYEALVKISPYVRDAPIPYEVMAAHLLSDQTKKYALSLLAASDLSDMDSAHKPLIQSLLEIAQTDSRATLVLMHIGSKPLSAQTILCFENWLAVGLPTYSYTLRLLMVLLQHQNLREAVSYIAEFSTLLSQSLDLDIPEVCAVICTIVRRVPQTKELLKSLSDSGFLSKFYRMASKSESFSEKHSIFLLTDTLARVGYSEEFLYVCEVVLNSLKSDMRYANYALSVAVRLSKFEECRSFLKESGFIKYAQKLTEDSDLSELAKKALEKV